MWDEQSRKFRFRDDAIPARKDLKSDDNLDGSELPYVDKSHPTTKATAEPPVFNLYGLIITAACVVLTTVIVILLIYFIIKKCQKRSNNREETSEMSSNLNVDPYFPPYYVSNNANDHRTTYSVYNASCEREIQCRRIPYGGHASGHYRVENNEGSANQHSVQRLWSSNGARNTLNPLYNEDSTSGNGSDIEDSSSMRDLYILTDRSVTQEICGKLVVSVTHLVDHVGDVLYLDNMGISLKIPRGAVSRGKKELIFLVLNWDLSDNPDMKSDESLVSPVVYVGPHGLKLNKPCTLIFRHCSYNSRQIRVMRSKTELHVQKDWNVMIDQNDVTGQCYFTADECQIKINTFTLYTCVQAPFEDQIGKKWLQIAVFACPLRKENNHHQIRVYFLNKTPCALQWAIQNEAKFGGKMVCPEKVFLFDGNVQDMFAKTRYISDQWELVEPNCLDKISFVKIWHGQCPHISICYRRLEITGSHLSNRRLSIEMNLHLYTYQHTHEEDGEKLIIQICEDNITPKLTEESVCNRHHLDKIVIDINSDQCRYSIDSNQGQRNQFQGHCGSHCLNDRLLGQGPTKANVSKVSDESALESCVGVGTDYTTTDKPEACLRLVVNTNLEKTIDDRFELDTENPVRRIPYGLRKKLKLLLDAKHMFGSDWRDLANELDLNACIPILSNCDSPTEKILDQAEQRGMTLEQLREIFASIERKDCVEEIERCITTYQSARVPVKNGDSSIVSREGNVPLCQRIPQTDKSVTPHCSSLHCQKGVFVKDKPQFY